MQYLGHTYIKNLFVVSSKFKYKWVFCTLLATLPVDQLYECILKMKACYMKQSSFVASPTLGLTGYRHYSKTVAPTALRTRQARNPSSFPWPGGQMSCKHKRYLDKFGLRKNDLYHPYVLIYHPTHSPTQWLKGLPGGLTSSSPCPLNTKWQGPPTTKFQATAC